MRAWQLVSTSSHSVRWREVSTIPSVLPPECGCCSRCSTSPVDWERRGGAGGCGGARRLGYQACAVWSADGDRLRPTVGHGGHALLRAAQPLHLARGELLPRKRNTVDVIRFRISDSNQPALHRTASSWPCWPKRGRPASRQDTEI